MLLVGVPHLYAAATNSPTPPQPQTSHLSPRATYPCPVPQTWQSSIPSHFGKWHHHLLAVKARNLDAISDNSSALPPTAFTKICWFYPQNVSALSLPFQIHSERLPTGNTRTGVSSPRADPAGRGPHVTEETSAQWLFQPATCHPPLSPSDSTSSRGRLTWLSLRFSFMSAPTSVFTFYSASFSPTPWLCLLSLSPRLHSLPGLQM